MKALIDLLSQITSCQRERARSFIRFELRNSANKISILINSFIYIISFYIPSLFPHIIAPKLGIRFTCYNDPQCSHEVITQVKDSNSINGMSGSKQNFKEFVSATSAQSDQMLASRVRYSDLLLSFIVKSE